MIQMRSWLTVADNSGARRLMCILPVGGDIGSRAGLGDIITASVKEATPESPIKKGKVVRVKKFAPIWPDPRPMPDQCNQWSQ